MENNHKIRGMSEQNPKYLYNKSGQWKRVQPLKAVEPQDEIILSHKFLP